MKNKIIITINNLDDRSFYQELGINNFAYPLKDFCVGMPNTFFIDEIPSDSYLFINRILDNNGIDNLKNILNIKKIKGIIFDDLGVLELIKDLEIEKILYLSHFNSNSESIKIYLEYVDSVIISTDITKKEIQNINDIFKDKLTLFIIGYLPSMYSRRLLLDNYSKFYNISKTNPLLITNSNQKFLIYENEYGTIFYHYPLFNGVELMHMPAKYYFINTAFLTKTDVEELLNGTYLNQCDDGFLNKETIYKLKEDQND